MTLITCPRCRGIGRFPECKHIENGICFLCRGTKFVRMNGQGKYVPAQEEFDEEIVWAINHELSKR